MSWPETIAETVVPGITSSTVVQLEGAALVIAAFTAFIRPQFGSRFFTVVERRFLQLANGRKLSVLTVGAFTLMLRVALLPVVPVPVPGLHDEFSNLLAADTFVHGRLANATHPMWAHFESFHINQQPTYASMYPPMWGLILAAGKVIGGHPWVGMLFAAATMCAAITWMLQGWFSPAWALLGGTLVSVRLAMFSYWVNSYYGGAVAAIGGAFVFGALPRIRRNPGRRDAVILALGIAILLNSRPFEGMIVSGAAILTVVVWTARGQVPLRLAIQRIAHPIAIVLAVVAASMAYYNWRVFGSPLTPPYIVNRATYAVTPMFMFQHLRPAPLYRHDVMRTFYLEWEVGEYRSVRSFYGFLQALRDKYRRTEAFFLGPALWLPLLAFPRSVLDRSIRVGVLIGAAVAGAVLTEVWLFPHYLSPVTCVFYAVVLEAIRRLRGWRVRGRRPGLLLSRAIPVICVSTVFAIVAMRAVGFHFRAVTPQEVVPRFSGLRDRAAVMDRLSQLPGKHLMVVRYAPNHNVHEEWVYNDADIDAAKIVWARAMDDESNQRLVQYFLDRRVWLVEPDVTPVRMADYLR